MTTNSKWLVPILALSLAANVFIAGVLLGKQLNPPPPPPPLAGGAPGVDLNVKRLGQYLSKGERRKVREILRNQQGALAERYKRVKSSEQYIKSLISAERVDRKALLAALENHGALMQQIHTPMQRVMMEVIVGLSQETREKVAESMFRRGMPRHQRNKPRRMDQKPLDQKNGQPPHEEEAIPPSEGGYL